VELRHLRYFRAVAEHRSFTSAAKQLHVSQSGVSGQVRDLEREIGVTLLRRNQRDVSLTAEGTIFLREAREILEHSERAVAMTIRASEGLYGKLTVGLCGPATATFLPALIREFRTRHPDVMVALKDLEPALQPGALADGRIDLGFTRSVPPDFRKILSSEVLFREPLVAVLPKGHALSDESSIQLAQLSSESFVLYAREAAPDLFDVIVGFCKRAKFSPRLADSPTVWQSVLTLVEAGEGVALVPGCVRHLRSHDVVFKELRGRGYFLDVVLAWRRDEPDTIRDTFLTVLRKNRAAINQ